MTNPEKIKVDYDTEKENEQRSDEESAMREIVLGLPALSITTATTLIGVSSREEEEARLNEQAVVAAELVIAAAEEAAVKEKSDGKKKKVRRQRKVMKLSDGEEAGGSSSKGGGEAAKKARKKTSEFTNLPRGPPVCNVCGRAFGSWKAVFGHLRSHKDRNYRGFLPPPRFTAPTRGVMIPGPNSAFVRVVARGGSVVSSGGGGGAGGGEGGRGLGVDMNVGPVEKDHNQEGTESGTVAKFDLNKSPPKEDDDEEEDKTK